MRKFLLLAVVLFGPCLPSLAVELPFLGSRRELAARVPILHHRRPATSITAVMCDDYVHGGAVATPGWQTSPTWQQ